MWHQTSRTTPADALQCPQRNFLGGGSLAKDVEGPICSSNVDIFWCCSCRDPKIPKVPMWISGNDHGMMKDGAEAVARMCGKNWGTRSQWCSVPRTRPHDGDDEMKYPIIYQWISLCRKRSMLGDRQTWTFLTFLQVLQCCWTPPWAISWTSTDTAGHLT